MDEDRPSWLGLAIACVITLVIGYSWGSGSKTPYIDSLTAKLSAQSQTIGSLQSQLSSNNPAEAKVVPLVNTTERITPPVTQTTTCAITTCNDGSCSSSVGRGTCSWHGGVDHY